MGVTVNDFQSLTVLMAYGAHPHSCDSAATYSLARVQLIWTVSPKLGLAHRSLCSHMARKRTISARQVR
jgi:hypothetical protein